jgi:uridylate kinase
VSQRKRILLKLSGEALAGGATFGIDAGRVKSLAQEIVDVAATGVQIGMVVGGGNIFRGVAAAAQKMDRVTADQMGMLATVINSLALQDALEQLGLKTRVMSAIDTAAAMRALEIKAEVIAKATRVDGVYDKDPLKFPDAVMYSEISYLDVLSKALGVMDATSIAMCRDNHLPIIVFNLNTSGNIMRMTMGEPIGTLIH